MTCAEGARNRHRHEDRRRQRHVAAAEKADRQFSHHDPDAHTKQQMERVQAALAARSIERGGRGNRREERLVVSEDVQIGLQSASYSSGRYSVRREVGVHHFHRLLAQALRAH